MQGALPLTFSLKCGPAALYLIELDKGMLLDFITQSRLIFNWSWSEHNISILCWDLFSLLNIFERYCSFISGSREILGMEMVLRVPSSSVLEAFTEQTYFPESVQPKVEHLWIMCWLYDICVWEYLRRLFSKSEVQT